ncbi:hypothetical protein EDD85DRAFT_943088 [Armillaria nabsnona]|nr:hypothetical protein EDD85DRAFT_943088 [Armillaria nabsnona]
MDSESFRLNAPSASYREILATSQLFWPEMYFNIHGPASAFKPSPTIFRSCTSCVVIYPRSQTYAYIFHKFSSDLLLQDVAFSGYNDQCRALTLYTGGIIQSSAPSDVQLFHVFAHNNIRTLILNDEIPSAVGRRSTPNLKGLFLYSERARYVVGPEVKLVELESLLRFVQRPERNCEHLPTLPIPLSTCKVIW